MKTIDVLLHGGDYNPEQWLKVPGVIDRDFELFREANLNVITIGVFSWAALEPEEGHYDFEWMDDIFARAEKQGMQVILATPSGGKPNWLALKYEEVRRVDEQGHRDPQRRRHNHCLTSPVYRTKVRAMNEQLATRYGQHPALALWHISNEFGGYCYCDLCMGAFQRWLEQRYKTTDALNDVYWSRFWSHTYRSWDQVRTIDEGVPGLVLDWKRFMTHQCCDFIRNEVEPIRRLSAEIPVTTNMMGTHPDYDYWELAKEIDVVSWDAYPSWHHDTTEFHETNAPLNAAFRHDLTRSLGGRPFLLMESTASQVNWADASPLLRPGMLRTASLQAVAHGADSVCYFQLRKSRGSCEQFHGAVIDHVGHSNTRVFKEVAALGASLKRLNGIIGADNLSRVAVIFDWETRWIFEAVKFVQNQEKHYADTVIAHYKPFWELGISVDVVHAKADFSKYDLVVAPILFMVSDDTGRRLTDYVERGGTLVTTYGTGVLEETGLAIAGGMPGPLRKVLGIWIEESDALPANQRRHVAPVEGGSHGLKGTYQARHYLDIVHLEGAEALAVYDDDFYAGSPALTQHAFGKGQAWHVASRNEDRFTHDFLSHLAAELNLPRALESRLPTDVSAQVRTTDTQRYVFVMNFGDQTAVCDLGNGTFRDAETAESVDSIFELPAYTSRVLAQNGTNLRRIWAES